MLFQFLRILGWGEDTRTQKKYIYTIWFTDSLKIDHDFQKKSTWKTLDRSFYIRVANLFHLKPISFRFSFPLSPENLLHGTCIFLRFDLHFNAMKKKHKKEVQIFLLISSHMSHLRKRCESRTYAWTTRS